MAEHTHLRPHIADDDLLFEYASGVLDEAQAMIVAAHLSLCPQARRIVQDFEQICGALIESCDEERVSEDCLQGLLSRLDEAEPPAPADDVPECTIVPKPVRQYLNCETAALNWETRPDIDGVEFLQVDVPGSNLHVEMMRMSPGAHVPTHSHAGSEMTLVIDGGYTDENDQYVRGCFTIYASGEDHTPVADEPEGCLCITVRID